MITYHDYADETYSVQESKVKPSVFYYPLAHLFL